MEIPPDGWCFACGEENPHGLKLSFSPAGEGVEATFRPERVHQGYRGLVHGGIISTLLDEAMAKVLNMRGIPAVTAKMEVRFRNPLRVGEEAVVEGWLESERRDVFCLEAEVRVRPEDKSIASASAVFMRTN